MYTGRTQNTQQLTATAVALFSLLVSMTGANAQTRLSSNPNDLRDAFASHPTQANSPEAFANFVAKNQSLSQRYARHFGVPQERIVSFFKTSLVATTLPKPQTFTTYGVTRGGDIYPVKTTLPAGSQVWATRDGVPVIKWNCSNPLATSLPGSTLTTPPLEFAHTPSPIMPSGLPGLAEPESFGTSTSASLPADGNGTGDFFAVAPPAPGADTTGTFAFGVPGDTGVSIDDSLGFGEIVDAGRSAFGVDDLWPALLIPAILAAGNGGTADDTVFTGEFEPSLPGGTGQTAPSLPGGPVVVPEANTAGMMLAGLPLLAGAWTIAWCRRRAA